MNLYANVPTFVFNLLIHTSTFRNPRLVAFWQAVWKRTCKTYKCPVKTIIHGKEVIVNYGYTYPIYSRRFPSLNNPLIELIARAYKEKMAPIVFADIGAAVGDTVLLVQSNCPGMIQYYYCVEGDNEFFSYLKSNLSHLKNSECFHALLSSAQGKERALLRTHAGTASAQGENGYSAVTLDSVLLRPGINPIDVIKIDVDGLDGKVLAGSCQLLQQQHPAIIFEWHPGLCKITGNNWTEHFEILVSNGYTRFVWFTKFGEFSHFTQRFNFAELDWLAELCFRNRFQEDWHFDVVALHDSSPISVLEIAELESARAKRSSY
jgi:FkbM family methyltransferase